MTATDTTVKQTPETTPALSVAEAARLRFIDPAKLSFFKAGATLRMTIADEASWLKVDIVRVFPLSLPNAYFSVRDGGGKEVGILKNLDGLDATSRALAETELERRYLVAIIHRVLSVKERFGTVEWEVTTNRGRCRFTTRDLRDNALRYDGGHYLITDVENNRYEIPDIAALDRASQSALLRHL